MIHKSYKFRLHPNREQEELIAKHIGCSRWVYNNMLNLKIETYKETGKSLSKFDLTKNLPILKKEEKTSFLSEVNSQTLTSAIEDLDNAYQRFFKEKKGFPKFKSKHDNKQTFRAVQSVRVADNMLFLPKFKSGIKMNVHRPLEGRILFATVSKNATGKYYVSITCETEYTPYDKTLSAVGIDTGIKDLAILSDGTKYENIKSLKTNLKKLKYQQRQLSKKQKGSKSRERQKLKLASLHERVTNVRKDYLSKVSTDIIKKHDIISVENLAVKNMVKNHNLAQALSDVSLGTFYIMLEYKAKWNEKQIIKINRFFPSSKTCSCCGFINDELTLSVRKWTCKSCDTTHDRDLNASKNILNEGLKLMSEKK